MAARRSSRIGSTSLCEASAIWVDRCRIRSSRRRAGIRSGQRKAQSARIILPEFPGLCDTVHTVDHAASNVQQALIGMTFVLTALQCFGRLPDEGSTVYELTTADL